MSKEVKEQPKCKTCGDTGKRMCASCSGARMVGIPPDIICPKCKGAGTIPCPDCQQPTAGEFTKNIRDTLEVMSSDGKFHKKIMEEACDFIDRAKSINADLLEACRNAAAFLKGSHIEIDKQMATYLYAKIAKVDPEVK